VQTTIGAQNYVLMVTTVAVVNDNCCYCLDVSLSLVLKIVDRNVCVRCASMLLRVPAKAIKGANPDETIEILNYADYTIF